MSTKKIIIILLVISTLGGVAFYFGNPDQFKGSFSDTNDDETVIDISSPETGDLTNIDFDLTEQEYTLGYWNLKKNEDLLIVDHEVYIGDPKNNVQVDDYFDDLTVEYTWGMYGTAEEMDYDSYFKDGDEGFLIYQDSSYFKITGTPKAGRGDEFESNGLNGEQLSYKILEIDDVVTDADTYTYDDYPSLFDFEESGFTYGSQTLNDANNGDPIIEIEANGGEIEIDSTRSIDFDSTETYTLGAWEINKLDTSIIILDHEVYIGDPQNGIKVDDYFDNLSIEYTWGMYGTAEEMDYDSYFKDGDEGFLIYQDSSYFKITGTPKAGRGDEFESNGLNGEQLSYKILEIDDVVTDADTYTYDDYPSLFDFEEDGFSYGNISTGEAGFISMMFADAITLEGIGSRTTDIDWSSDEYQILGVWELSTIGELETTGTEFYIGDPADEKLLKDYFVEEVFGMFPASALKITTTEIDPGESDYAIDQSFNIPTLDGSKFYADEKVKITVSGIPNPDMEDDYESEMFGGKKVSLKIGGITAISSGETDSEMDLAYEDFPDVFIFDEDGFSYSGITLGEQTFACDSLTLAETATGSKSSTITYTITSADATAAGEDFSGIINVSTSGTGALAYKKTKGTELSFTGTGSGRFTYLTTTDGDIISASVEGEETNCSSSLTIAREIKTAPVASTAVTTSTAATYNDSYITILDVEGNPITDLDVENFLVTEKNGLEIVDFDASSSKSGIYKINLQETPKTDYKVLVSSDGYVSGKVEIDDNTADYAASVTLHYGYAVYPVTTDNEGISGATVTAGDDYEIECIEVGTGAIYTCVIPLDHEDIAFKVEAEGYDDYDDEFKADRTENTDIQIKAKAIMTIPGGVADEPDTTTDTDNDLLTDYEEENEYFTDPKNSDSDADNLSDYEEVIDLGTDPNNSDTDGDGSPDGTEVTYGTDPLVSDVEDEETEEVVKMETNEFCTPFDDIVSHWSETDVCTLYTAGFVKGKSTTIYDPDNYVTRAEFLKLIMLESGYDPADETDLEVTKYKDVNQGDWYYDYVALADENGFLWYPINDNWLPNEQITRGDAILLAIRIAKLTLRDFTSDDSSFTDFDPDSYQAYAIVLGEQYEIISGYDDGTFKANNPITRAEAAVITNNAEVLFE